jgi:predicted amidohydrolase
MATTAVLPAATKATATTTTGRRAAIAQLCSTKNKCTNLLNIAKCAGYAKAHNAVMLFLPECCGFMGDNAHRTLISADPAINVEVMSMRFHNDNNNDNIFRKALANQINIYATTTTTTSFSNTLTTQNYDDLNNNDEDDWPDEESFTSSIIEELRYIACESQLWISGGGIHTRATTPSFPSSKVDANAGDDDYGSNDKIYNTHVIIDNEGRLRAHYHKIHLFDVNIPNKICLQESKTTLPGTQLVTCDSPLGKLGLSICYDMRFSEMYVDLVSPKLGAQILLMPSAFTIPTGKAHWHTLLRARAIESQCYVIAAAQVGNHNDKRESYGHSVVYDPWGELLADAGGSDTTATTTEESPIHDVPSIIFADIDLEKIELVRERLPMQMHRDGSNYSY